jgi:hypothetical protein
MLRDKDGNRLFRKITVKIIYPDAIFPERTYVQHAGAKQGFGPDGVDAMLMDIATKLDELYPWWDFKAIELTPIGRTTRYVFTFAGYRAMHGVDASAGQTMVDQIRDTRYPIADSSTPEPETIEVSRQQGQSAKLENALKELSFQELVPGE